jgi:hypothetical protein
MNTLLEREQSVLKEISEIIEYLCIFMDEKTTEIFNAINFNEKLNAFVILTTITLKEIVNELAANHQNIEIYENMDMEFYGMHLEFKKFYDKKIQLSQE